MQKTLEQLPRLTVRDLIAGGAFARPGDYYLFQYSNRLSLLVRVDLESMVVHFGAIDHTTGTQTKSTVGLVTRTTNLGNGSMWLFHSFRTGKQSRVLFLVDGEMVARADIIKPRYKQQLQGRTERMWLRYNRPSPARPYGKPTYRGKLTPYGRRLQRYDQTVDDLNCDAWLYFIRRFKLWREYPELEQFKTKP